MTYFVKIILQDERVQEGNQNTKSGHTWATSLLVSVLPNMKYRIDKTPKNNPPVKEYVQKIQKINIVKNAFR